MGLTAARPRRTSCCVWAGRAPAPRCARTGQQRHLLPAHPRKHPPQKIRKKAQSFATPQLDSGPSDSLRLGHTGVFIKGPEVIGTAVASEKRPPLRPRAESPRLPRNRSLSSPSRTHPSKEDGKGKLEGEADALNLWA